MGGEQGLDAFAIFVELSLKNLELLAASDGEKALGGDQVRMGLPLRSRFENSDALFVGLWAKEAVAVEEIVPLAFACFGEGFRIREGEDEGPRAFHGPIIEGFERGGIKLMKSLLELIEERGAFLDES